VAIRILSRTKGTTGIFFREIQITATYQNNLLTIVQGKKCIIMAVTVRTGIVYLQKDNFNFIPICWENIGISFCCGNYSRSDIVNSEFLEELIRVFVVNSRIPPSNLIFVMAENTYFTKDFSYTSHRKIASQEAVTKRIVAKRSNDFVDIFLLKRCQVKQYHLKKG